MTLRVKCLFVFFLLVTSLLTLSTRVSVYASELPVLAQKEMASSSSEKTATYATPLKRSTYTLPYPGILPTHPLYFLKAMRDRVMLILIGDMVKKTEFAILQADKRVNTALMLRAQKKDDLAQTTLDKAQKYREQAIEYLQRANQERKDTSEVRKKLDASYGKHEEVLQDIISQVSGEEKVVYESMLDKLKKNRELLQKI